MNSFRILSLVISVVILETFAKEYCTDYTQEDFQVGDPRLEKQFINLHPDIKTLETNRWPLAENISDAQLKDLCNQVIIDLIDFPTDTENLSYVPPATGEARTQRVIREALVHFKRGIYKLTLLCCTYKRMEFYLAQGAQTDASVFRLDRDRKNNFYFESGPHNIEKRF